MKKLLLTAALLASPAMAEEAMDDVAFCQSFYTLATSIMEARQNNVSIATLMSIDSDPSIKAFSHEIIVMAYQHPRFSVYENQQTAVKEFANDVFMMCLKGVNND